MFDLIIFLPAVVYQLGNNTCTISSFPNWFMIRSILSFIYWQTNESSPTGHLFFSLILLQSISVTHITVVLTSSLYLKAITT